MAFFNRDFLQFFKELAPNNNKEWFDANRKRYEKNVKDPFRVFTDTILKELKSIDPLLKDLEAKDCIFRINRDIRFSQDKSPYKLHMAAAFSPEGKKDFIHPGLYIEFNPEHIRLYSGVYQPDKEVLFRIRSYMAAYPTQLLEALKAEGVRKYWGGTILGERNKTLPAEFKQSAATLDYLYLKQFYYLSDMEPQLAEKDQLMDEILRRYKAVQPLNDFFRAAVQAAD